mgnify:CR=1 FL=1
MRSLTLKKRGDGVAVLLFDTPKRPVNVLSGEMLEEAGPLMEEIQDDDGILACVLASAKPDSFIAAEKFRSRLPNFAVPSSSRPRSWPAFCSHGSERPRPIRTFPHAESY